MTLGLRLLRHPLTAATLLGALAGLALALDDTGETLAYVLTIPRGFIGLPLPANLDWIAGWIGTAQTLSGKGFLFELVAFFSLVALAFVVFRTLNPDFRLTPPPPPDAETGAILRQPVDRRRLLQIGGALLISVWLLGYFGAWLPWTKGIAGLLLAGPSGLARLWPASAAPASVAGLMLLLAGLWLTWGEAGFLRPPPGAAPRMGPGRALAASVLAGLALTPFALPLAPWAQQIATEVLQGIGGAARDAWLAYLGGILVVYPLALGAAGWTAVSLARWSHFSHERRALAAGGMVALLGWLGVFSLLRLAGAGRFDHGVPLSQAAGVSRGPGGVLTTFTLLPGPKPVVGQTPTVSGQGLTASDPSARLVWAYLQYRRFRTVHLFPALMHVCQCEALAWNSDRFLDNTLRSLEQNPHPGFCQLLIDKLAHSAATPTARRALERLQDSRRFHLPPGMGRGIFALRRRLEPEGSEVRGRLRVEGGSPVGIRVGLLDERFWQEFRGAPTALTHRLVVASSGVDADGAFRLRHIPRGRYLMVVAVPAREGTWSPDRTVVRGSPGPILVRRRLRQIDVGTIRLILVTPERTRPARGKG